ncbi:MAG: DUF3108 domain-containing protein [Bacteroidota bacterium]|nr:DUF3108 domain-containing protein [Bacteroidota bacterium]
MKLIAVSAVLALTAIFIFPTTSHSPRSLLNARELESITFELPGENGIFMVGEELEYNVSYTVFDLGSVKFHILDTTSKNGKTAYVVKAFVDSYSGVPFVSLHQVFYSEMTSEPYSLYFSNHNTANPKEMPFNKYSFDYDDKKVTYQAGKDPENSISKTGEEPISGPQQDGLSLFYYARAHCRQVTKEATPIFVNDKTFYTQFNFMNKIGSQEIDAVKYPIQTNEFDGTADFTGIFGLTGYFRGFFSNDDASIPIVAKMKVLLGSIHIELTKWNRPGWTPPEAKK